MRRRLFTLASAVSLLLCLGTAVLWARSMWYYDSVTRYSGTMSAEVVSLRGRLLVRIVSSPLFNYDPLWKREVWPAEKMQFAEYLDWKLGGFAKLRDRSAGLSTCDRAEGRSMRRKLFTAASVVSLATRFTTADTSARGGPPSPPFRG